MVDMLTSGGNSGFVNLSITALTNYLIPSLIPSTNQSIMNALTFYLLRAQSSKALNSPANSKMLRSCASSILEHFSIDSFDILCLGSADAAVEDAALVVVAAAALAGLL